MPGFFIHQHNKINTKQLDFKTIDLYNGLVLQVVEQ